MSAQQSFSDTLFILFALLIAGDLVAGGDRFEGSGE